MQKKLFLFLGIYGAVAAQSQALDTIVLGNPTSETAHGLTSGWGPVTPAAAVEQGGGLMPSDPSVTDPSDVVIGGLGQSARRLLPRKPNADVYGGEINFTMAVDPVKRNHLTIKLWGKDPSAGVWFLLNVDGLELGLRHGAIRPPPVRCIRGQWALPTASGSTARSRSRSI